MSKIMIGEDDYIIPDAVFSFTSKERPYLFLFEMYDGKDTGRVIEQVKKHVKAISLASPSEKHNIQYSHRVLLVFEFESMKNAFLDRLNNDLYFSYVYDYFLCKSMEGVQHNFFSDWKNLQGEVRSLI